MSVFSIAGFLLALPAGLILNRVGAKLTGAISVGCIVLGSLIGTFAVSDGMLLASRTIEGIGMAVIGVMAPMVLSSWFPPEKQGVALGVWSTWVSVGSIIMLNSAPLLAASGTWQNAWWFATIFAAVAVIIFWVFFRMPDRPAGMEAPAGGPGNAAETEGPPSLGKVMAKPDIWKVAFMLFCFNIMVLAVGSYMPTFLSTVRGFSMQQAGFISSLLNFTMLASCPLGGWLSDRIGSRKKVYVVSFTAVGLLMLAPFSVPATVIPFVMVALGIFVGPLVTTIVASVPEVVRRPELVGFGMAIMMTCHHLGEFIGPILFGKIVETNGWAMAGYALIPICLLGAFVGGLAKVR